MMFQGSLGKKINYSLSCCSALFFLQMIAANLFGGSILLQFLSPVVSFPVAHNMQQNNHREMGECCSIHHHPQKPLPPI